jgi:ketosteroid isomerase-like protein
MLFAAPRALAQSEGQLYTATRNQLDVAKTLIAQQGVWNTGDLDAYVSRFYKDAPDTEAVLGAPAVGVNSIRNAFRTNFANREMMGELEESEVQVRELGANFALATGHYHLTRSRKGGGNIDGSFADVFEKTSTGWQIIFSEST